jgi:hypothetical protein
MDLTTEGLYLSERDIILSIINSRFIIDYGSVTQDNGDGTVNVQHAVPMTPKYPTKDWIPLSPTITKNVEVLYISGGQFSTNFKVTVGDPVLLVGLKDFVQNTKSINNQPLTVFNHYNQNTLKAIPLAGSNANAKGQINVTSTALELKYPSANVHGPNYVQSDATTDPTNWPLITTLGAIFGLTITQAAGKLNTNTVDIQ